MPCRAVMQNGFVESFDGRLRNECLNEHLFANLRHAQERISAWRRIARICGTFNLVIFIRISSGILLRKFYVRIPLVLGRVTHLPRAQMLFSVCQSH